MMKLVWHPLALNDMQSILTYCRKNFGRTTAVKVREKLRHDSALLMNHPQLGQLEDELNDESSPLPVYRSLLSGPNKIVYTVHSDYIFIHLLWNTRRNPNDFRREATGRKEE